MQNGFIRREIVRGALIAGAVVPTLDLIGGATLAAAGNPSPSHSANQNCANCEQFLGKKGDLHRALWKVTRPVSR